MFNDFSPIPKSRSDLDLERGDMTWLMNITSLFLQQTLKFATRF